ncbi:IPT/TIG domain-containing protein, partial [bacterium]|nr:IPT/TIG domain-containing protein [bacterium]
MFNSRSNAVVLLLGIIFSAIGIIASSASAQGQELVFTVFGDIPYGDDELPTLMDHVANHNLYSPSEFVIHIGDLKKDGASCEEIKYQQVFDELLNFEVPTFVLPGDNEWNDCSDVDEAWSFWSKYFIDLETNFCLTSLVSRQTVRPENFAFVQKGVLIVGLNLVGGEVHDQAEWDLRLQQNADWIRQQFEEQGSSVRAAVVFGHAGPGSNRDAFFSQFSEVAGAFGKPVLYAHGNGHSWRTSDPFPEENITRVQVDKAARSLPVQVTVTLDSSNPFILEPEPWNASSPVITRAPCGSGANITANPGSHNFGQILVDSSSSKTIQIMNNSDKDFNLADVRLEGVNPTEFNLDNSSGAITLSPLEVVDVLVSFNPTSFGQKSADLVVEGGDSISYALTVPLTGLGHIEADPGTTPVNYMMAFIADQGDSPDTREVLQLIKDEGAQAIVHGGDFDYSNDAAGWENLLNQFLGPDIPVFATLGEDEESKWHDPGGYQERLAARMTTLGITWDGDLGVQSSFTYNGIFFVQTSEGITDGDHAGYLRDKLGATNAIWRISTFHKNMKKLQICGHSDRTGWEVYEESRKGGAIITNAQCHVYARTHLLSNFEDQTVVSTSDTLLLSADDPSTPEDEGRAFDVISGLGGKSRHNQETDGDWWATTYARHDPSEFGALFGIFNYNGNPSLAKFYFKTVTGKIIDTFYVVSPLSNQNRLTVNKDGEGSVDLNPDGGLYEDDELVMLQANPAEGWVFVGWDEDLTGSENPTSLIMDSNKNVTARFDLVAPLVAFFTPSSGQIGMEVTITGLNFTNPSVFFNNIEATVVAVDSDTLIRAIVPNGATSGKIRVTNALGSGESAVDFNVILPPTLSSFTPDIGPPGTEVTISGSSFTAVGEVAFNGIGATVVNVDSDTQLRAEVPGGAKTGPLSVTNAAGTATSVLGFQVTAPPTTLNLIPIEDTRVRSSAPTKNYGNDTFMQVRKSSAYHIAYLKFEINGIFGLVQSAKLRLEVTDGGSDGGSVYLVSNDYKASSEPWTEEGLIWDNAPPIAGSALSSVGEVVVGQIAEFDVTTAITGSGTFSFAIRNDFSRIKYSSKEGTTPPELVIEVLTTPVPVITSLSPGSGLIGTEVTLTGANFTGTTDVWFGSTAASFSFVSDSKLHAVVPTGGTTGRISVTNADGTGESGQDFLVISAPTITGFSPASGTVGDEVTMTGTFFSTVTEVSFGTTVATNVNIDSDSQLRMVVPSGAGTGKLGVTNSGGTATSTDDFVVLQPPVISGFSPSNGPIGSEVTVTGENCLGATSVMFGGTPADTFAVDSATELRAWVPNGANSGKISVTSPDGTGESAEVFTVINPPTLADFNPTSGPPGTEVTLTGTSFSGSKVFFNGVQASTVTIDSDTQIRAQVPLGASSGSIEITNSAGSTSSLTDFTVTSPPSKISVTVIEDTRVRSSQPTKNYGNDTFMQVRKSSAYHIAYLKFEINGI